MYDYASDKPFIISIVVKTKYREIQNTDLNFMRIYTDGSKDSKISAVTAITDCEVITFRLPDNDSGYIKYEGHQFYLCRMLRKIKLNSLSLYIPCLSYHVFVHYLIL